MALELWVCLWHGGIISGSFIELWFWVWFCLESDGIGSERVGSSPLLAHKNAAAIGAFFTKGVSKRGVADSRVSRAPHFYGNQTLDSEKIKRRPRPKTLSKASASRAHTPEITTKKPP